MEGGTSVKVGGDGSGKKEFLTERLQLSTQIAYDWRWVHQTHPKESRLSNHESDLRMIML